MNRLFESRVNVTLGFKRRNCEELVSVSELNAVRSLCKLLEVLATPQNGVELGEDRDAFSNICKMWFFFWCVKSLEFFKLHNYAFRRDKITNSAFKHRFE